MLKYYYLHLILLAVSLQACVEPVELDLPTPESKLVVVCNFTNDLEFRVVVSKTNAVNEEVLEYYVTNADVAIYTAGKLLGKLRLSETIDESGIPYYVSNGFTAQINQLYEIRVKAPGFKPVSSFGIAPVPSGLTSTGIPRDKMPNSDINDQIRRVRISIEIDDPANIENFYHLNLYQQVREYTDGIDGGTAVTKNYGPLQMFNLVENQAVLFYFNNRGVLINDQTFNGQKKAFSFEAKLDVIPLDNDDAGNIIVELRTVSEDYYLYYVTLKRQYELQGNPLSNPIFDFTNIDNGSGIFAGFSVVRDTLVID